MIHWQELVLKVILKYKNNPSIHSIGEIYIKKFLLDVLIKKRVLSYSNDEISNLDTSKAFQD